MAAASTLAKIIDEVRVREISHLWQKLALLPDSTTGLLKIPEGLRVLVMAQLRKGPVTTAGPSFVYARERFNRPWILTFSQQGATVPRPYRWYRIGMPSYCQNAGNMTSGHSDCVCCRAGYIRVGQRRRYA